MPIAKIAFVAAGPVIIEEGKVLLIRDKNDDFWKFPGGKVEDQDATLEDTTRREVREELGLEIVILAPLAPWLRRLDDGRTLVFVHFLAQRRGEPVAGDGILEWRWFPTDAVPNPAPNIMPVLASWKDSL